jgi:hypothetical protein
MLAPNAEYLPINATVGWVRWIAQNAVFGVGVP